MFKNRPFLRWFTSLLFISIATSPWLTTASVTYGCTPPPGGLPDLSIADRVGDAPIVLEGTVTQVFEYFGFQPNQLVAVVEVSAYYKGYGPATIAIEGYGQSALCLQYIRVGGPFIFYVEQDITGNFRAHYASQFDAYTDANDVDVTRAEVIAATGRDPLMPDSEEKPAMGALQTAEYLATNVIYDAPPTSASAAARTVTAHAIATETQIAYLSQTGGPDIFFDLTATQLESDRHATATRQAEIGASEVIIDVTGPSVYRQSMTADAAVSLTAQAQLTTSHMPPSPTYTPTLETANESSNSSDSDGNDLVPFILGFLTATAIWIALGIGYWIGRRAPTNPNV